MCAAMLLLNFLPQAADPNVKALRDKYEAFTTAQEKKFAQYPNVVHVITHTHW